MAVKKKKKVASKKKAIKRRPLKKRVTAKKKPAKKIIRKPPVKKKGGVRASAPGKPKEKVLGVITHYFPKVRAAVIKLKAPLANGDVIKIKGHTTNLQQIVSSMQIDHVPVDQGKKGQEIGLLVSSRVRQHDTVHKA
ncbi:MAG: hypothetical protein ABH806_03465 [Candidatus Omnitrophota bacterium]